MPACRFTRRKVGQRTTSDGFLVKGLGFTAIALASFTAFGEEFPGASDNPPAVNRGGATRRLPPEVTRPAITLETPAQPGASPDASSPRPTQPPPSTNPGDPAWHKARGYQPLSPAQMDEEIKLLEYFRQENAARSRECDELIDALAARKSSLEAELREERKRVLDAFDRGEQPDASRMHSIERSIQAVDHEIGNQRSFKDTADVIGRSQERRLERVRAARANNETEFYGHPDQPLPDSTRGASGGEGPATTPDRSSTATLDQPSFSDPATPSSDRGIQPDDSSRVGSRNRTVDPPFGGDSRGPRGVDVDPPASGGLGERLGRAGKTGLQGVGGALVVGGVYSAVQTYDERGLKREAVREALANLREQREALIEDVKARYPEMLQNANLANPGDEDLLKVQRALDYYGGNGDGLDGQWEDIKRHNEFERMIGQAARELKDAWDSENSRDAATLDIVDTVELVEGLAGRGSNDTVRESDRQWNGMTVLINRYAAQGVAMQEINSRTGREQPATPPAISTVTEDRDVQAAFNELHQNLVNESVRYIPNRSEEELQNLIRINLRNGRGAFDGLMDADQSGLKGGDRGFVEELRTDEPLPPRDEEQNGPLPDELVTDEPPGHYEERDGGYERETPGSDRGLSGYPEEEKTVGNFSSLDLIREPGLEFDPTDFYLDGTGPAIPDELVTGEPPYSGDELQKPGSPDRGFEQALRNTITVPPRTEHETNRLPSSTGNVSSSPDDWHARERARRAADAQRLREQREREKSRPNIKFFGGTWQAYAPEFD